MNCEFCGNRLTFQICEKLSAKCWNILNGIFCYSIYFRFHFAVAFVVFVDFIQIDFSHIRFAGAISFFGSYLLKNHQINFIKKNNANQTNKMKIKKLKKKINSIVQEHTFSILFYEQKSSQYLKTRRNTKSPSLSNSYRVCERERKKSN